MLEKEGSRRSKDVHVCIFKINYEIDFCFEKINFIINFKHIYTVMNLLKLSFFDIFTLYFTFRILQL